MDYSSIVHWFPELEAHSCGYCKQSDTSISYGMWAEMLTVEDYQNLIDRGWRRSGKYCYKPVMQQTCCPLYTIRCSAENFQTSKSQKKVIKRFNKFLQDGKVENVNTNSYSNSEDSSQDIFIKEPKAALDVTKLERSSIKRTCSSNKKLCVQSKVSGENSSASKQSEQQNVVSDGTKVKQRKAKQIRMARKKEKLAAKGIDIEFVPRQNVTKGLDELLQLPNDKLKIVLVPTSNPGKEWDGTKKQEYELYKKYQIVIHGDEPDKCNEQSFHRFLLHSPLQPYKPSAGPSMGYGSFHQQYWLENRLIAVGVIDILPFCVSSVYFFYDPDYRHLTLGTYGSLREFQFTRDLHKNVQDLQYYYMGFYVHSCPKMRYKANYRPSFLLCPETYAWYSIDVCLPKLDAEKYSRLNDDIDALDENVCSADDLDDIKIIYNYQSIVRFKYYKTKFGGQSIVKTLAEMLGRLSARSLLIVLPTNS